MSHAANDAQPIEHYGAIGNGTTVALVGRDGSIDWCCFPALDSPSAFGALLDTRRGGRFRVSLGGAAETSHRYRDRTNVLETTHRLGDVLLEIVDFFPVDGDLRALGAPFEATIHRLVTARGGRAEVEVEWSPRFDYARGETGVAPFDDGYIAASGGERATLAGLPRDAKVEIEAATGGQTLRARFKLDDGASAALVMRHGSDVTAASAESTRDALASTARAWSEWCDRGHDPGWAGRDAWLVERSALALKLLCFRETGAIAAAATTSLPEAFGGIRNWDYRYAWLRDAAMTVEALLGLGHPEEAGAFIEFARRAETGVNERDPWLQIVFGLRGETEMPVRCLEHLEGYGGAAPVRIGNGIARHRGHDVYEQLLGAALEFLSLGHALSDETMRFLGRVADICADEWARPDFGIWEMQRGAQHYIHSKWTAAVALSHAATLSERFGIPGDAARWRRESEAARRFVMERGYDAERARFKLIDNDPELDSANVLMPVLGFLPAHDARVRSTLQQTIDELGVDRLCRRYVADDGLEGEEGAFLACGFWLVEALVLAGDLERAREFFDRSVRCASPLGLFSEEFDPRTNRQLGNVPQAFSHVAFVDAALRLAHAEGREVPAHPDPAGIEGGADDDAAGQSTTNQESTERRTRA